MDTRDYKYMPKVQTRITKVVMLHDANEDIAHAESMHTEPMYSYHLEKDLMHKSAVTAMIEGAWLTIAIQQLHACMHGEI